MEGLAADFTAPRFGTVLQTAKKIAASDLPYDHVIYEYGEWVHFQIAARDEDARRKTSSKFKDTGYLDGLVSKPR